MQRLRLLVGRRAAREEARLFVVEGRKPVGESIAAGAAIETVFVDVAAAKPADLDLLAAAQQAGASVTEVQPGVLDRVCDTVTPQPVVATVRALDVSLADMAARRPLLVAVLAGVADPGNAGSILRSVAAAGDGAVVICGGSVDLYNPKTVRSSAGAIFRVPVVKDAPQQEIAEQLSRLGYRVFATSPACGESYTQADLSGPVAIFLGSEAHGLPPSVAGAADATLSIPLAGGTESLGVAAAGAVITFEAARQRRAAAVTGGHPASATDPAGRIAGAA